MERRFEGKKRTEAEEPDQEINGSWTPSADPKGVF
jgi:hypothetical protein